MTLSMQLTINDDDLTPKIDKFECEWFCMDEAISTVFRLETVFISHDDYTRANIVGKTAWFNVSQDNIGRVVGGVILEFRVLNKRDINSYTYSVVLGPRLSLLDKTIQSEVLAPDDLDVRAVLAGVLSGHMNDGATISKRGVTLDFRLHGSVSGFERKNITKYNESDLNFFQRTCEYYGIFYTHEFKVTKVNDKINVFDIVVVASDNTAFSKSIPETLHFKAPTTTAGTAMDVTGTHIEGAVVFSLEHATRPGFQQFSLRNYSPKTPFEMLSKSEAHDDGIGGVVEYGDNFDNSRDGDRLAAYRAQEAAWQTSTFECKSAIASLGSGQIFTLVDNPIKTYDTDYLIVSMRHEAGRRGPLGYGANYPTVPYRNSFTAIEATVPFRPRRITPKPVMSGVYNAIVQSPDSSHPISIMDEYGRYLVGFVYNEAESRNVPGQGSGPIRQVQPYAGGMADSVVSGLQFPLVNNTEVLVSYENGDPDRPIILGAAFNKTNMDVVNRHSPRANRIRTTSGLLLEMNDGEPKAPRSERYIRLDVPQSVTDSPPGNTPSTPTTPAPTPSGHYLRLGNAARDSLAGSQLLAYSTPSSTDSGAAGNSATGSDAAGAGATGTDSSSTSKQVSKIPSKDGILIFSEATLDVYAQGAGLMRFGSGYTTKVDSGDSVHEVSAGGVNIKADKDIVIESANSVKIKSGTKKSDWIYGQQVKYVKGTAFNYFNGAAVTFNISAALTCQLAGTMSITAGLASTVVIGSKLDVVVGAKVDLLIGKPVKMATLGEARMTAWEQNINAAITTLTAGIKSVSSSIESSTAATSIRNSALNSVVSTANMNKIDIAVQSFTLSAQMAAAAFIFS